MAATLRFAAADVGNVCDIRFVTIRNRDAILAVVLVGVDAARWNATMVTPSAHP